MRYKLNYQNRKKQNIFETDYPYTEIGNPRSFREALDKLNDFKLENKEIKIFTDGANLDSISRLALDPMIDGITTNPTLMRSSGVTNYMTFAKAAIRASEGKSLSLEIFSDEYKEMLDQAFILSN